MALTLHVINEVCGKVGLVTACWTLEHTPEVLPLPVLGKCHPNVAVLSKHLVTPWTLNHGGWSSVNITYSSAIFLYRFTSFTEVGFEVVDLYIAWIEVMLIKLLEKLIINLINEDIVSMFQVIS